MSESKENQATAPELSTEDLGTISGGVNLQGEAQTSATTG
jgi:hypothetical protein